MVSPLAERILKNGVRTVDFSKLAPDLRRKLCDEIGELLAKRGAHADAAYALGASKSPKLRELSSYLLGRAQPEAAAEYALYLEDEQHLRLVAAACMNAGASAQARALFAKLGDAAMLAFIDENLPS